MLNFLFGDISDYEIRLRDWPEDGPEAPPIIKLCGAIIKQASIDNASKVRFVSDPERGEMQLPPSPEMHEAELERQRRLNDPSKTSYRFRQIMAEAGIVHPPQDRETPKLCVDFLINGEWCESMTIPATLKDPVIRRYQFHFNYQNCVSLEIPENLIYVNGDYCSLSLYTPRETILAEISLEPDPDR